MQDDAREEEPEEKERQKERRAKRVGIVYVKSFPDVVALDILTAFVCLHIGNT